VVPNPKSGVQSPESPLILASTSPRRREILESLGLNFRVVPPREDLPPEHGTSPEEHVIESARAKALSVKDRVRSGWIVGVDTEVAIGRRILGKPADRDDARRMLKVLSGRTHRVISGVAVLCKPGAALKRRRSRSLLLSTSETSRVTFRRLSGREINAYLRTNEPYDKAGAYGIQGRAGGFVAGLRGSYLNVVGLPVLTMLRLLVQAGYRF